ncbi:class I SAM-dependent methyltransferase [Elizabethkingia bruuniana]|uniref:class I SAM-dependent methyltransferase n=2 Tax=Elizabethkingia bruuniana TaxID=1756149 RepID=UPI0021A7939F|nr:class I SAM-dependent methyltransferase [Elizabethkingia bruuniana]
MTLTEAINMINPAFQDSGKIEKWTDLGCGKGLYTNALAEILPGGSEIYSIDKDNQTLPIVNPEIKTEFIQHDFSKDLPVHIENLDGILMANSLHYILDKEQLLRNLKLKMKSKGRFVIIEYDTQRANSWVPYPINFIELKELFAKLGYPKIEKIAQRKSVYQNNVMFTAVAEY